MTEACRLPCFGGFALSTRMFGTALRVYAKPEFPQAWATTQNNLGIAWSDLIIGEGAANLGKAIDCLEAALRVYTKEAHSKNGGDPKDLRAAQEELANSSPRQDHSH